jgi:hypothetical protein
MERQAKTLALPRAWCPQGWTSCRTETKNKAVDFVDNSLAKSRQRTGPLAVDKSQKTATYPPRDPLPTSSTDHLGFDMKFESQNQTLRLIPLLELTLPC